MPFNDVVAGCRVEDHLLHVYVYLRIRVTSVAKHATYVVQVRFLVVFHCGVPVADKMKVNFRDSWVGESRSNSFLA